MATIITKTIGTAARNYSTPSAWEAAEGGVDFVTLNEIHVGEMYADSIFTTGVVISGATTDSTHYMHLKAATGQEHLGIPGAGVVIAVNAQNVIDIQDAFTIVEGLEIDGGAVETNGNKQGIRGQGSNCIVRSNIVHGLYAKRNFDFTRGIECRNSSGVEVYNNLVYDIKKPVATASSADTIGIKASFDNSKVYNNTIVDVANPLSSPEGSRGISAGTGSGIKLQNNIVMDTGGVDFSVSGFTGTSTNNMDSDGTSVGTLNQQNKLSSNQFVNAGARDYHLKTSSSGISNGTPITVVTIDIAGNIRDVTTPDIGSFEFVTAGGIIITPLAGSISYTGQVPIISNPEVIQALSGSISYTGQIPIILSPLIISPPAGFISYSGQIPTIVTPLLVPAVAGAINYVGQVPAIVTTTGINTNPPAGVINYVGQVPTIGLTSLVLLTPPPGLISYSGQIPIVAVSSLDIVPLHALVTMLNSELGRTTMFKGSSLPIEVVKIAPSAPPLGGSSIIFVDDDGQLDIYAWNKIDNIWMENSDTKKSTFVTSNYVSTKGDFTLYIDASGGSITFTLLASFFIIDRVILIKRIDVDSAKTVTIDVSDGSNFEGSATQQMYPGESFSVAYDGTQYWMIG